MKKSGRSIRCLIFDLDGTLVSTQLANFKAYRKAFAAEGIHVSKNQYDQLFGLRFEDLIKQIAPKLTTTQKRRVQKLKSIYYRKNFEHLKLNLPLVSFMKMLKGSYKLALVTTSSRINAESVLRQFKLLNIFDIMIFGEDVNKGKPAPDCFQLCMNLLRVKPSECLVFEDSKVGIVAAMHAGASVIQVPAL